MSTDIPRESGEKTKKEMGDHYKKARKKSERREMILDKIFNNELAPEMIVKELRKYNIYKSKDQDTRSFLRICMIRYINFSRAVATVNRQLEFLK